MFYSNVSIDQKVAEKLNITHLFIFTYSFILLGFENSLFAIVWYLSAIKRQQLIAVMLLSDHMILFCVNKMTLDSTKSYNSMI